MRRLLKRTVAVLSVAVIVLLLAAAFTLWMLLRASLPRTSGELAVEGLPSSVTISRDARGVPVISAESFEAVATGLGFVHAQDRFFQMDLLRRSSAGELAELLGAPLLPRDRENRAFRFRRVAMLAFDRLPERHRRWMRAYARGVNAGLADLAVRPPEYLALRATPTEWRPEDSLLVALTMHQLLSHGAEDELMIDAMRAELAADLVEFLTPDTTRFDAPLIGPHGNPLPPAPIPMGSTQRSAPALGVSFDPEPKGSNSWAVGASRSAGGRAILACDMHLPLAAPNTWYRAQLEWNDDTSGHRRAVGVTIPGVPAIVAGSNGSVAWGFTNVTGDFEDHMVIEVDPDNPSRYRTPDGWEPFGAIIEHIDVAHAPAERLELRTTRYGPVTATDARGRPLVLRWAALDPERLNLDLLDMQWASTLDEAIHVAHRWHGPPQNISIADRNGRIAWTITGWIPHRVGFDGRFPVIWGDGVGWAGAMDAHRRPLVIDPPSGFIYSANQRMVSLELAREIGHGWASGARAGRIAELLDQSHEHTEASMLAIQLDTLSRPIAFLQRLALDGIAPDDPQLAAARSVIERWNGRADADQSAFRILARFHAALYRRVFDPLVAPVAEKHPGFLYSWFQSIEPLMRLLEEQPPDFLPGDAQSWPDLIRDALTAAAELPPGARDWSDPKATWGALNRARIQNHLSRAIPWLGRWLDMPADPLPGHGTTVRVQSGAFGASERLVVSPGREEDGILHMPAGQSGHFLSPHYADGHADWVTGAPTPLLAGPPVSQFQLVSRDP